MKRIISLFLVLVILIMAVSCGNAENAESSAADAGAEKADIPSPAGADSVKELVEKSVEFFRGGCDYSKIESIHDPVAHLALFILEDLLRDRDLTFQQARETAKLLYGTAEELRQKDPELEKEIRDEFDVMEPEEIVNEFMTSIRDRIRGGAIGSDDPNYETFQNMLTDWDKGPEYMFQKYSEVFGGLPVTVGTEGALKALREYAEFKLYNPELLKFKEMNAEFKPENIDVGESGFNSYDMGKIVSGYDVYMLDMNYYYENGKYYIINYTVTVGGMGG